MNRLKHIYMEEALAAEAPPAASAPDTAGGESPSGSPVADWFKAMAEDIGSDDDAFEFEDAGTSEQGTEGSVEVAEPSTDEGKGETSEAQPEEPKAQEVAAQPEAITPAAEEPQEPVVQQAATPQPVAQPEPPAAPTAPATITEEQRAQMRNAAAEELQKRYAMDDATALQLRDSPEEVLPKLAANMYLDIFEQVTQSIMQHLPTIVQGTMATQQAQKEGENAFFSRWKALDTPEGRQKAIMFGKAYRQAYPNAPKEQFIEDVGLQAMVAMRLPIEGYGAQAPAGNPPVVQAPRTPASPTSAPTSQPGRSSNPFTQLADEFLQEEY
ncbi:MAG: hypothetical protein ACWGQW_02795 [bacterium]